jgi:hypothetical protein
MLLALSGAAWSQSYALLTKFEVDQPVVVGRVELPAGEYSVRMLDTGNGNVVLAVESLTGARAIVLANRITSLTSERRSAAVSLTREDGHYLLDQVWASAWRGYQIVRYAELVH